MATTHIGLLALAKTPAKSLLLIFFLGCQGDLEPALGITSESLTEKCGNGDNCAKVVLNKYINSLVHIEVEPTAELAQVFYSVNPNDLENKPLIMTKKINLTGYAQDADEYIKKDYHDNDRDKLGPYSDIVALPLANKLEFLSPRIPNVKTKLSRDAKYELNILGNIAYAIILNPNGSFGRAPRLIFAGLAENIAKLDFLKNENITSVIGRLTSSETNIFMADNNPYFKVGVFQGSILVSSVATIEKNSDFNLELATPLFTSVKNIPLSLVVEPLDHETALPRIRKILTIEQNSHSFDVGEIDLGRIDSPFEVYLNILGEDNSTVGQAYLLLSAHIGNGQAMIKKQLDESGKAIFANIYAGVYDIAIIPPFDSSYALQVLKNVEFLPDKSNRLEVKLAKRKNLDATIRDHVGELVNGAQIEFFRIGKVGDFATEDIFDDMQFKLTAITNQQGLVCHRAFGFVTTESQDCEPLSLDDGRYLAHVIPPAGSRISHKWLTFDFPINKTLDIKLSEPEILSGQILADDLKTPIKRAFVTIYLAQSNIYNQPRVIGNAITDDEGKFSAFVPAKSAN